MWLLGVVVRRYIDFLILLIPTPLVSVLFYSSILTFCSFFKMFFVLVHIDLIHDLLPRGWLLKLPAAQHQRKPA